MSAVFRVIFRPEIIGKENIPKDSAAIIAGNHTDFFDCFMIISATDRCVHFLAKNELFANSFTKRFFTSAGLIRVYRNGKDREALLQAEEYLKNGCLVGIFPQGTTSRNPHSPLPFKTGAVRMSQDTGAPVVPFTISGKYRIFRRSVQIVFHKPYTVTDSDLSKENRKLQAIVLDNTENQGE